MSLFDLFDSSLIGRRGEPALEWQGRLFTFGELEERSNRVAAALAARGLRQGDRLCVYLPNCIEFIDLFLASLKLGVLFVPVNILYREREIAHIAADAAPKAWIGSDELPPLAEEAASFAAGRPSVALRGSTPAAIIYTSGTTGTSKGAVLTHGNFAANIVNLLTSWRITAADRLFLALPLFHIHGLGNGIGCWLASGCRIRLLERFDYRTAGGELRDFRPTLFFGVPTMYARLLELDPEEAADIGRGTRLFVSGSAPLPADVLTRFAARFGRTILERYGMTETFMTLSNPYDGERRAGTVGFPLPGVSVRIEEGELLVRGATIFSGYWNRPEATAAAFTADGFFRTGDLASVDEDGYYTLRGRKSDLIITGGFNVFPREVEELLLEQEGVREAAVVGVPDPLRGEVPIAFVVGECDFEELERVCRRDLASFKLPRRFVRVESLPRNAMGKVQKGLLREMSLETAARESPSA